MINMHRVSTRINLPIAVPFSTEVEMTTSSSRGPLETCSMQTSTALGTDPSRSSINIDVGRKSVTRAAIENGG